MHRFKLAMLISVLFWPTLGQGATPKNFKVETTKDLVTLCSVTEKDAYTSEAIHFCHGFLVGAFHYYLASTAPPGIPDFVCVPEPRPSRNEAISGFIDWTKEHPKHLTKEAVNTLFRYLEETYPCSK